MEGRVADSRKYRGITWRVESFTGAIWNHFLSIDRVSILVDFFSKRCLQMGRRRRRRRLGGPNARFAIDKASETKEVVLPIFSTRVT